MQNAVEEKEANFTGSVSCYPDLFYYSSLFQRFLPCGWAAWCLPGLSSGPRSVRVSAAPLRPDHPHLIWWGHRVAAGGGAQAGKPGTSYPGLLSGTGCPLSIFTTCILLISPQFARVSAMLFTRLSLLSIKIYTQGLLNVTWLLEY